MGVDADHPPRTPRSRIPRWVRPVALVSGATFLAIQLVPLGRDRSNPPVVDDAPWPSSASAELARAACYDCHSNETRWPVYAHVAPVSWLVIGDVRVGRDELNFSVWGEHDGEADDAAEAVAEGSMPPARYTRLHPDAALDAAERQLLVDALLAMEG